MLDALQQLGFDVLFTANNHALDQGVEGVVETHEQLDQRGLLHLGTNAPGEDTREFLLVSVGDAPALELGLVNATFGANEEPEDPRLLQYLPRGTQRVEALSRSIRAARAAGADYVVVFLHWGREYHVLPAREQRELARQLCLEGADMILGAGPHAIQPVEFLHSKQGQLLEAWEAGARQHFVAYSLGNFVSHQRGVAQYGLLLDLILEDGEAGVSVRHARPHVLRSVVRREESALGGQVRNHDTFQLQEVPLAEFLDVIR
jgi:poly-gamma-glutamate synthesis protein (capsule biosynthesis protein)